MGSWAGGGAVTAVEVNAGGGEGLNSAWQGSGAGPWR